MSGGEDPLPRPARRDNLPAQPSRLIGRDADVAALLAALRAGERLLTLTGPGGAGKTRLAVALAAAARDAHDAGAWLAELGAIGRPEEVAPAILAAVAAAGGPARDPAPGDLPARLAAWLAGRRLLLVLDNFEQLPGAAPLVGALLDAAPGLSVIVTSRILLGLPGEREWPVPPLPTPPPDERDLAVIAAAPAVRLFVERARAAAPGFRLDGPRAAEVAAICRHLDGLPLAIELAAARTRILPPAAILARLDERIALLSGGPRDLPGRHQSIEAAIAWSDELLAPPERSAFRRLAVFHAPWSAADAEAAGAALPQDLDRLASHSLLRRETGPGGEPRYRMFETVHAFAAERLAEDPAAHAAARDGHARWVEAFVAEHENRAAAVHRGGLFDRRLEDILAAIAWRDAAGRPQDGLRTAIRLGWYWYLRGRVPLGARLLAPAETGAGAALPPAVRAAGLSLLGLLRMNLGDLGPAARVLDAAGAIFRAEGDEEGELEVREHLADLALQRGDLAAARSLRAGLLASRNAAADPIQIASAMNNLAEVEQLAGDDAAALALLAAARAAAAGSPDRLTGSLIAGNLGSLGAAMLLAGSPAAPPLPEVRARCAESLRYSRETGDAFGVLAGLLAAAAISLVPPASPGPGPGPGPGPDSGHAPDPAAAARLLAAAESVSAASGIAIAGVEALRRDLVLARLVVALAAEALVAALAHGRALSEDAAVRLALSFME